MTDARRMANRLAAWALIAGAVLAVYLFAVRPVTGLHGELDAAQARTAAMAVRYGRISERARDYDARLEELVRRQASSGVYLTGETAALAAAQLQNRLNTQIRRGGGTIRSLQVLPAKDDGDFKRVLVRVRFTATTASFHTILHALESGTPLIFVEGLEITSRPTQRRADAPPTEPALTVRLDLAGYLRPEA